MPPKKLLLFIINPISGPGKGNKTNLKVLIDRTIDKQVYDYDIAFTEYANHATELANKAKNGGYDCVVAIGGDGTINEVARAVLHSPACLGVVPSGSGNGLARHLKIPLDTTRALEALNNAKEITIDTGLLNDHPFLCTAGVGFDAHIGKVFAESDRRGFMTYLKKTVTEFSGYKNKHYRIELEDIAMDKHAFIVAFANAGQYGNNAHISPYSDIQDGLLDLCVVKNFPKASVFSMGVRLFNKSLPSSKYVETYSFKELSMHIGENQPVHIDGEPFMMEGEVHVKIVPASLKVMVSAF